MDGLASLFTALGALGLGSFFTVLIQQARRARLDRRRAQGEEITYEDLLARSRSKYLVHSARLARQVVEMGGTPEPDPEDPLDRWHELNLKPPAAD